MAVRYHFEIILTQIYFSFNKFTVNFVFYAFISDVYILSSKRKSKLYCAIFSFIIAAMILFAYGQKKPRACFSDTVLLFVYSNILRSMQLSHFNYAELIAFYNKKYYIIL